MRFAAGFLRPLTAVLLLLSVVACGKAEVPVQAAEPTRETSCALDGMLLLDYPGPKGQIVYDKGEVDFFCDTMEMMSIYLRPEQQKRIRGVFTQDMAKADWQAPRGNWIDAKTAFYVLDSKMLGSMGPTLATFARQEDAEVFAKKNGGKVLRFNEITVDMVQLTGGVVHDERM